MAHGGKGVGGLHQLPAGGVADVSGNRVAETIRWTFTTGVLLETPKW